MTTAYPTDADALREALSDKATVEANFGDPDSAVEYIEGYAAASHKADQGEIAEQVAIEVQKQATAMARDNGYAPWDGPTPKGAEGPTAENGFGTVYNHNAVGVTLDSKLKDRRIALPGLGERRPTLGTYMQATWHNQTNLPSLSHLNDIRRDAFEITNAYSSNIGSAGGFLIPEEFRAQLLRVALESAVVRGRAVTIPMSSATITMPTIDVTSHASSLFGGVVTYWTAEAASMTATEAKFGQVKLEPNTLTGYAVIPDQQIADTAFLDAYFSSTFPPAMAYQEDEAFLVGLGVGEPLGVFKGGGTVIQAKEGSQSADTVQWENIVNMFARLPPQSMSRAVWVVNQTTIPQLLTMTFSGIPVMIDDGGGPDAPNFRMLGLPVIISEKVSALGDEGDVNLVDLGFYLIGDRQAMTVDSSNAPGFQQNTTAFRVTERVDGRPWIQTALTPRNGSTTLSPYIRLAERA